MDKPFFIKAMETHDPDWAGRVNELQDFVGSDTALPAKVKTLMAMLCDAILAHGDGVAALADRARALGASEQEIAETVRMALYCGGMPGLVTGTFGFAGRSEE